MRANAPATVEGVALKMRQQAQNDPPMYATLTQSRQRTGRRDLLVTSTCFFAIAPVRKNGSGDWFRRVRVSRDHVHSATFLWIASKHAKNLSPAGLSLALSLRCG
jgi:hypothetical protein